MDGGNGEMAQAMLAGMVVHVSWGTNKGEGGRLVIDGGDEN